MTKTNRERATLAFSENTLHLMDSLLGPRGYTSQHIPTPRDPITKGRTAQESIQRIPFTSCDLAGDDYNGSDSLHLIFEYSDTFPVGLQSGAPIALNLKACQAKSANLSKLFENVPMLT